MGYRKSKPGMFKMKHQGVPALLKTLTGGQKDMVSKMRQEGNSEAANKIEKGIRAAAPKKMPGPIKKDENTRAKSSAELKRDDKNTVVGTSTERGGDQPIGTRKSTKMIASRTGKSFDDKGNVKIGKNKKFMDNLTTLPDGTVVGYKNTAGDNVRIPQKDRFNVKEFSRASRVGGRLTGTGIQNPTARRAASEYYRYNMSIDNVNRASDRASKVVAAEEEGSNVRYKKKDTKTAPTKKVKGIGPVKKAGVGTKSIKERIYEDGKKKKKANTTKRATITKQMYKK